MNGNAAEHIREGIPVLASYCDALGVRAFAEGKNLEQDLGETLFGMIDELCDKPLINLESAVNHPCQALADWRTLDELKVPRRAKFVLSWVYHPKALPLAVPAATVHMAAMRGMEVVVLRPDGYALPAEIMDKAGRGGHGRGERAVRQGMGHHPVLRRHRGRRSPARGPHRLVRARALVRGGVARGEAHALPAGAPQCGGRR
jgi:N-acetylornithine carbamoyltransferase